jgi:hypothetical protein
MSSLALYAYELPKFIDSPEKSRNHSIEIGTIEKGLKDIQRNQGKIFVNFKKISFITF